MDKDEPVFRVVENESTERAPEDSEDDGDGNRADTDDASTEEGNQ